MKYINIFGIIFTLGLILMLSGCVSNNVTDNNDQNNIVSGQPLTDDQIKDLQNQVDEIQNSEEYKDAKEALDQPNTNEKVTYCKIDMGEVTQKFWFAEKEARMLTEGPGNFVDKTINETLNCSTDEQGRHACFPMDEPFDKTVEGWETMGQLAGTCNTLEYDMKVFKALTE